MGQNIRSKLSMKKPGTKDLIFMTPSDGGLEILFNGPGSDYDRVAILESSVGLHPISIFANVKALKMTTNIKDSLCEWTIQPATISVNKSGDVTFTVIRTVVNGVDTIFLRVHNELDYPIRFQFNPRDIANGDFSQTEFIVNAQTNNLILCIPPLPGRHVVVNNIGWQYFDPREEDKKKDSFAEKYHVHEDYTLLYDEPQFKIILISEQAKTMKFDFEITSKRARVYVSHSWGSPQFFQPCIQAKPFCNAKLTSLRFSDKCGCATANPDERILVAELVPDNVDEEFCFFLRIRAGPASHWNLTNTENLRELWESGKPFLEPNLRTNALFIEDYVYEKIEYSNGVSIAFREKDEYTHEMYCDNHLDEVIRLEFEFWAEHAHVTPHEHKGDNVAVVHDLIPARTRVRLIEIDNSGQPQAWKWNHSWKWFREDIPNVEYVARIWNRFCFLHPEGHAGVLRDHIDQHIQHLIFRTQNSWFDAELAWRSMTNERQTDWLSFQTVLRYYTNPLEQDVPYNIIDFFMFSEEEIMQAFSGTLLEVKLAETMPMFWDVIFQYHPIRRRFLWPIEKIQGAFVNTWLAEDEAQDPWQVICDFLGW